MKTRRKDLSREKKRQDYKGKWILLNGTMQNLTLNALVKSIKSSRNLRRVKKQQKGSKRNVIQQCNTKKSFHITSKMYQRG